MPLTDTALRNLKPADKAFKKTDSAGLYVLVKPNGAKLWRFDYRFFGIRKTLALGIYPAVSLADARAARDAAKTLLAKDVDPGQQKLQERTAASNALENTFGKIADEFLVKIAADGRAAATIAKNTWMLKDLAVSLARRPITEIEPSEVLAVLQKIERSGRIETALKMRSAIGRVFRFAIATARAKNDPTFSLRGALRRHKPTSFAAIVGEKQVGGLVRAVNGYDGWPTLAAAIQIQMYCFARPGETRSMEWAELDFDKNVWRIPAHKTKMRRPLDVPLSRQALAIIERVRPFSEDKPLVFASMMSGKTMLSENSMNSALRRMGYMSEQHTAHGFRSTASSLLNESKLFHPDVIETQLAHQDKNAIRRIYNRAEHWDDRVRMMQWWADYLDDRAAQP